MVNYIEYGKLPEGITDDDIDDLFNWKNIKERGQYPIKGFLLAQFFCFDGKRNWSRFSNWIELKG